MDFNEANEVVHKVEEQWHYPIMNKYDWVPETPEGIGFVRSYVYTKPNFNIKVELTTGFNADYWNAFDENRKEVGGGYWSSLESFLKKINEEIKNDKNN